MELAEKKGLGDVIKKLFEEAGAARLRLRRQDPLDL